MSTDDITPIPSVDNVERLPSLDALQTAHKELLQAHRQEGDTPEMLDRIEAFIYQGQATGAVLDAEEDRWTAQGMLDYWSATLFRAARRAPDATLADFDPNLAPELPDELCPYVGLDPFREATQAAFFGRERLVATLVEKLADSRLLVVSGPSGSGKSSVVLAGLLPALQRGALPGSESCRYVPRMVPGSNPLVNLVRLIEAAGDGNQEDPVAWAQQQEKLLHENPKHLLELVNATGEAPVVGVVDQFEEAFTLCNDQQVRQAFIDNLVNLVQAPGARHTVILTMRTDFEPFVTRLPEFYALFEQALVRVTPLSASELREAIEKPASKIGLKFEAGLVDQLLQDLLGEPAGLPLLQFTLLKLWENRTRNRITWAVYNRLEAAGWLWRSADAFYAELIPEEQVTAKRILLRLVRPGEGLEFTSNRVRLRTLYQAGEAKYRVDQVLEKLIAAHLLRVSEGDVAADTQVEVAHEALVRNWPRLVDWLEEERQNIRQRQAVSDAAERWIGSGRDPGVLYTTETVVQEALRIVEASGVSLDEQEAEFIRASQEAQEAVQHGKEAARQRELEQARALAQEQQMRAEEQAKAAGQLRRRAVYLATALVLAVLLAGAVAVLLMQANQAKDQAIQVKDQALKDRTTAVAASTRALALQRQAEAKNTEVVGLAQGLRAILTLQAETPAAATAEPSDGTPGPNDTPSTATTPSPNINRTATIAAAQSQLLTLQATQTYVASLPTPVVKLTQIGPDSTSPQIQESLVFQVVAYDPTQGSVDGDGIISVDMTVFDDNGNPVHQRLERNASYCAFGGGEPSCDPFVFADQDYRWSSGAPVLSGYYLLRAQAIAESGATAVLDTKVLIEVPGLSQVSAPQETKLPQSTPTPTPPKAGTVTASPIPPGSLYAMVPDIDIKVLTEPQANTALETVQAPDRLAVIEIGPDLWVKVRTPTGATGWIRADLLTFEGDAELLPKEISYRVLSNRDDLPFIYGVAATDVAGVKIYLLANDLKTPLATIPVGYPVTLLTIDPSGQWYFVDMPDPIRENYLLSGWVSKNYIRDQAAAN